MQGQTSGCATPLTLARWRGRSSGRRNGLAAPRSGYSPARRPSPPEHRRAPPAAIPAPFPTECAEKARVQVHEPAHRHALRLGVGQRGPQGRLVRLRGPRHRRVLLPAAVSGGGRRCCRRRRVGVPARWSRAGRRGHQGRLRAVILRYREPHARGVRRRLRVRRPGGLVQGPPALQEELHQLRVPAGEVQHEADQMGGCRGEIDRALAFQLRHVVPVEAHSLRDRVHGVLLRRRVREGVQACRKLERPQDGAPAADIQAQQMGVGERETLEREPRSVVPAAATATKHRYIRE